MSHFEYRQIGPTNKQITNFNQLDLYFYKPKSASVGVKARFSSGQVKDYWEVSEVEFKFIKNCEDIKEGKTVLQHWKKVRFSAKFRVYTPLFISNHLQMFKVQGNKLDLAIKSHLRQITWNISQALKHGDLKQSNFKNNHDLARWLQPEDTVQDICLLYKNRVKAGKGEQGFVKTSFLYNKLELKVNPKTIYQTKAFEASQEKKLRNILKEIGIGAKENVSYPKFIEKINMGLL